MKIDLRSPVVYRLLIAASIMAVLVILGTLIFHELESHMNYGDSFYFTVQTLFSVGFGDIPPVTDAGKIMAVIFILFGTAIFLASVTVVGSHIIQRSTERTDRIRELVEDKRRKKLQALNDWADENNVPPEIVERLKNDLRERKIDV